MTGRRAVSAVMAIAVGTLWACTGTQRAAEAPRGAPAVEQRRAPLPPFVPHAAEAERKAKLSGIAPRLDELFRARVAEAGATAAVVGIVLGGELAYVRAFGERDVATHAPVGVDTVFRIASLTKSFTATAILKLRDQGKLELDAPAARYVPELAKLRGWNDAAPVTVRHLLTMTSGLAWDDAWGPVTFGRDERQLTAFLGSGAGLARVPGERYAYSNLGYALLGQIVARVSGMGFREYVSREVLGPLGMRSSGWWQAEPRAQLAAGYFRRGEALVLEPHADDGVFAAAGGLYTTMRDYARYAAFQLAAYAEGEAADSEPLRRSSVRELHRGHVWMRWQDDVPVASRDASGKLALNAANYGFGWVNSTSCTYENLVQHGGFEPGYFAGVRLLPKDGIAVVAFSTTASVRDAATFERTLALLREGGLLRTAEPVSPELARMGANVGRLFDQWDAELARVTFDPDSLKYSFFATIEQDLARLKREHGACKPAGDVVALNATQAHLALSCERGSIRFSLSLSPASPPRVQFLEWRENEPVPLGGARDALRPCAE